MSHVKNIFQLPRDKRTAIWNALAKAGMTPERALALLGASEEQVQYWVNLSPKQDVNIFDESKIFTARRVGEILGVKTSYRPPVSPLHPKGRVIYLPPCIKSLSHLWDTNASICGYRGENLTAKPGYWEIILPLFDSCHYNRMQQEDQIYKLLPRYPNFQRAPVLIAVLMLALELFVTGRDLIHDGWLCCHERTAPDRHVVARVFASETKVFVRDLPYHDINTNEVWSSAARWICD